MKYIQKIKNLFRKGRKCVRCGEMIYGAGEAVNVYDRVVGRGNGVRHYPYCKLKEGSAEWIQKYWINHFLSILYQPDWFAKGVYEEHWQDICDFTKDPTLKKRMEEYPINQLMKRIYPNDWDKINS